MGRICEFEKLNSVTMILTQLKYQILLYFVKSRIILLYLKISLYEYIFTIYKGKVDNAFFFLLERIKKKLNGFD